MHNNPFAGECVDGEDSADEEETLHNLIGKFITAITSSPSVMMVDSWE